MKKILLLLLIFCTGTNAAELAISAGAIVRPGDGGPLIRLEARTAMPDEWLASVSDHLHGYWQANANTWYNEHAHFAFGAGLGANYSLNEHWKIELGWGLVALNDRYINADHNLGSELNFETTIALAYQWQTTQSLRLNLYHWSNAGLASSNPGCEIVLAAYQFKF